MRGAPTDSAQDESVHLADKMPVLRCKERQLPNRRDTSQTPFPCTIAFSNVTARMT